eukprot:scaffold5126_cov125-Isochrysis_galbana.AAC.11
MAVESSTPHAVRVVAHSRRANWEANRPCVADGLNGRAGPAGDGGAGTGAISSSFVVCFTKKPVVLSCSHSSVFTPPSPVEGPEELNFARVGGGRPDLAEGRGVGAGPPVSILEDASGKSFWPIGPTDRTFKACSPVLPLPLSAVVPCESIYIGEWAVRVPVGKRRFRRSPPALRPRIRRLRDWVVHCQIPPSV